MSSKFRFFVVPELAPDHITSRWTWVRDDAWRFKQASGTFEDFTQAVEDARRNGFDEEALPPGTTLHDLIP